MSYLIMNGPIFCITMSTGASKLLTNGSMCLQHSSNLIDLNKLCNAPCPILKKKKKNNRNNGINFSQVQ